MNRIVWILSVMLATALLGLAEEPIQLPSIDASMGMILDGASEKTAFQAAEDLKADLARYPDLDVLLGTIDGASPGSDESPHPRDLNAIGMMELYKHLTTAGTVTGSSAYTYEEAAWVGDLAEDVGSNLHGIYSERDAIQPADERAWRHPGYHYYYERVPNERGSTALSVVSSRSSSFEADLSDIRYSRSAVDSALPSSAGDPVSRSRPNLNPICSSSPDISDAFNVDGIRDLTNLNMNNFAGSQNTDFGDIIAQEMPVYYDQNSIKETRKYAVVVGINSYSDRPDLHTCVNDAETMAALLESYGYQVKMLTDLTYEKPTKQNILEKALGDLRQRTDLDRVLIYFSGHGVQAYGDYYLIPRDGNGQPSSYISSGELEERLKGLKNVALIVDACNSGGLQQVADSGQIVILSSDGDQPSNEVWFGSLSLFTYNLCNAIREEERSSRAVILERCFYRARESTERWSKSRLLNQTPQIRDRTDGYFILN
ncbi:MAG: caspase family protein [Methanothrix sp.]|nr:caspase family protein [Methanothrix sp.]